MTAEDAAAAAGAHRIVRDLVAHHLASVRRVPVATLEHWAWQADTLPAMAAAEAGDAVVELASWCGRTVAGATLAAWAEPVAATLRDAEGVIAPRTSGSTGVPRACRHRIADLMAECAAWARLLPPVRRVVCCVPVHHIYGAIWGVLLPALLDVPVVDGGFRGPGLHLPDPAPGDLVLGVPALWPHVLRAVPTWPAGVTGVTSTAPMPDLSAREVAAAGIALWQVYGSSETAAIGWRTAPGAAYKLLDVWSRAGDGLRRTDGRAVEVPDLLEWTAPDTFHVLGRRDGAVQVGGTNVFPGRVARILMQADGVAECAVRLGADARLKAYVVPAPGAAPESLRTRLRDLARAALADPERPRHYAFGPALPRDALGKLRDWD